MLTEVIFSLIFISLTYYYVCYITRKQFPPGEWGLPIIGYKMNKDVTQTLNDLRKKHGDIFMVKTGQLINVYLTEYNMIKTAFGKPEFSDRPLKFVTLVIRDFKNIGIIGSNGSIWHSNRIFALRILRDFGFGKSRISSAIEIETEHLLQALEKTNGEPTKLDWSLNLAVVNVLMQMLIGTRYGLDDSQHQKYVKFFSEFFNLTGGQFIPLNCFPWLLYILPKYILNTFFPVDKVLKQFKDVRDYLKKIIQEHRVDLDQNNPKDFVDSYLIEYDKQKLGNTSDSDDDDLAQILIDLYVAGSETTSSTIRWYCLHMAAYPKIQEKVQKELDSVVSGNKAANPEDKDRLPYFQATIYEIHRIISLIPISLAHAATQDTTFNGYKIPKNAVVYSCVELCQQDEQYWKHPDKFYPEHFLDNDGKFFIPKEGFLPFGLGRRQCMGESLAKMELFIFLSAIMKNFRISPAMQSGSSWKIQFTHNARFGF